MNLMEN